jgi:hypothetical protein
MSTDYVCVYMGDDSCPNCGGWKYASNGHFEGRVWVKDEGLGPFTAVDGNNQYCSEDCYEEAKTYAEQQRQRRLDDWCPECGYDRHEHSEECPRARSNA